MDIEYAKRNPEYKRGYVAARKLIRHSPQEFTRGDYDTPDAFDRGWRDGAADERARHLLDFSAIESRIAAWPSTPGPERTSRFLPGGDLTGRRNSDRYKK